ncbi:MAG TPA: hypothetical protein VFN39_07820 [Gemmatimonadaceae bacterium]|nr:hypothetical protein [Gemmatimonadaceae bacterium]
MTRIHSLAAAALVLVATPLAGQAVANASAPDASAPAARTLPPIPAARQFTHWGEFESSYDDDENSSSVSMNLGFDETQRNVFIRRGSVTRAEMSMGFVFDGRVMKEYPEVVTLMFKFTRPTDEALKSDRAGTGDIAIYVDGGVPIVVPGPLVSRNGVDITGNRARNVEDTYIVVLGLSQFLRIVNGAQVDAQLHELRMEFTGGPLEAMRDLASRLEIAPQ